MSLEGHSLQSPGLGGKKSLWESLSNHLQTLWRFVLKRAESPGQDHAVRQWRGMMDRQDWSSLQQESSNTGLESISNTAQFPLLFSCPTDLQGQLTHKGPCIPGLGAPGLYPGAAPPHPYPCPPQPQGAESLLTPTSPTPVCTIFRPSSCSSSPFTCSVDREETVRGKLPLHTRDPPETEPRDSSDSCSLQLLASAKGRGMYSRSPLFLVPGKGHSTAGRGREEQDQGDTAQLTSLAGHVCQ